MQAFCIKKMSLDKNQFGRMQVIHAQLNTLLHYGWEELAEECEQVLGVECRPSKRTLLSDIARLRDMDAPIPRRKAKYYYTHYFSLYDVLNADELTLLHEALALFRQFEGLDMFREMEEFRLRLETHRLDLENPAAGRVVQFEDNLAYAGRDHLSPLFRHIVDKQALQLDYVDFNHQRFRFVLHPYLLKEYRNRWYLFGRNHEQPAQLLNLALDRIRCYEPTEIDFLPNDAWDFAAHFAPLVGVTRFDAPALRQPETVRLRAHGHAADYLLTKPLHPSQHLTDEADDHAEFAYELVPNRELENEILALGPEVEVLAPLSLRARMREVVGRLAGRYGEG